MIETSWHSYPQIFALGHKAIEGIFEDSVIVQEKVDGSQISFGVFGEERELKVRSKGAQLNLLAPEGMFIRAIDSIRNFEHKLVQDWTYRGEYLAKPKHNALPYDRVPSGNIVLFDINSFFESYLPYPLVVEEGQNLGLETVPLVHDGKVEDITVFRLWLDRPSFLGGQPVEGVVVKNYHRFGLDKKVLMGKFVSEAFKEVHKREWKVSNPGKADIVQALIANYNTPARYQKAVQHLKERGLLEGSPRDIGALLKEAAEDIEKECRDEIAKALYDWAWPQIRRGSTAGLPGWYKDELLKSAFEDVA